MSIELMSNYGLIIVVAFVIVAAIVMSYCQQVQNEADHWPD